MNGITLLLSPVSSVFLSFILVAGVPPPGRQQLSPVPEPDLESLEPAVREQLVAAREILDETLREESFPNQLSEAYGMLGKLYHAYQLYGPAQVAYDNAIFLRPTDLRWSYYRGLTAQSQGDFDGAIGFFEKVLAIDPRNIPALVHQAAAALNQSRMDLAEKNYTRALEIDSSCAAAYLGLGQLALSRADARNAAQHFTRTLELVPEANRVHYPLALAYRALGEAELARRHLAQRGMVGVTVLDPLMSDLLSLRRGEIVHSLRGRLAFRAGRLGQAVASFEHALEEAPDSAAAHVNLATSLGSLGQLEEAMSMYRMALALDDGNRTARYNLGVLLNAQGGFEEAEAHLREAVRLDPDDLAARLELVKALVDSPRRADALEHLRVVTQSRPDELDPRLLEVRLLQDLGRHREARISLETSLGLFPANTRVTHALARFLVSCPDETVQDPERALDLARRAFRVSRTIQHAETVAMAFAQIDDYEQAIKYQEMAITAARMQNKVEVLEHLEKALAEYRRALEKK